MQKSAAPVPGTGLWGFIAINGQRKRFGMVSPAHLVKGGKGGNVAAFNVGILIAAICPAVRRFLAGNSGCGLARLRVSLRDTAVS